MSITKYIQVETAYTRSINLERDSNNEAFDTSYIPTSRALRTLGTIASRLNEENLPRAWSLIGPYGAGKSSFALYLSELLSSPDAERAIVASKLLKEHDKSLEALFRRETAGTEGYLEVLISGTPERLSLRYLRGLYTALSEYWQGRRGPKPEVFAKIQDSLDEQEVSVSRLLVYTKDAQNALAKIGCPGLLVVFDEFGKFLEYESRFLGVNDVFLLQALAEHAHSAHKSRLLVLVLLHQSIEQYARGVGESLKNEWAKIQGRFEEVPFLESAEQTLRVVSAAVSQRGISAEASKAIDADVRQSVEVLTKEAVLPGSLSEKEAIELFVGLYPLHPVSAVILPQLCQLISQNERTLFSYLGSREESGFRDRLERIERLGEFITPDQVFDYFLANQPAVGGDYLTQRRWAEAVSVLERNPAADEPQLKLLKTIGLINLLGNRGGIKASESLLKLVYGRGTKSSLKKLQDASALVHRKFNHEYRVWQGSDFDIETRLQDQLNQLDPFSLAREITHHQALAPIVARKYSIERGALRYFNLTFVDALSYEGATAGLNPQIFIYLAAGQDDQDLYDEKARAHLQKHGLVAYSEAGQALRQLVSERLALEAIERSAKELNDDPVARKEFSARLASIKQAELRFVTQLIASPEGSRWYFNGENLAVNNRRDFQERLSEVLTRLYPKAPEIHNELINRDKPSSQAAAARNRLLSYLIDAGRIRCADLAMEADKFPPEKAIYRAVLKETGIHRETHNGWELARPKKGSLLPVWQRIEEFFASTENAAKPFSAINAELLAPPYGVKAGVLPILWLSVYLVNEHEVALYEERRYVPGFTVDMLERFVKRPDQYSVQRFRIEGMRASIFKQYQDVVSGGKTPKTVLEVARPLASFMGALPEYTQKTKAGLSKQALAVRNAFNLAKSPEQLIFEGLPKALGFKRLDSVDEKQISQFSGQLTDVLRELKQAHPNLQTSMREEIASALGLDPRISLEEFRSQAKGRCHGLENYTLDVQGVRGLLMRINRDTDDLAQWFENILMFLGAKPSKKWTDADRDQAQFKLTQLSRRFTDLFKLAAEERRYREKANQEFDVYLLKSLKKGGDFIDEVVTIDKDTEGLTKEIKRELMEMLRASGDKEVQLAALAQVVDDFLKSYRGMSSGSEGKPSDSAKEPLINVCEAVSARQKSASRSVAKTAPAG